MILGNTAIFRLVMFAAVLGWLGYKFGPMAWPDARFTSMANDIRSSGKADTAHKLSKRYGYQVATYDGATWVRNDRPTMTGWEEFARRVLETPICGERDCVAYMANKTQQPFLAPVTLSHRFTLVWSEADGQVIELFEANALWRW